jgi:hypothetical protein
MSDITSNYFSIDIPIIDDADVATKTKYVIQMKLKLRDFALSRRRCVGMYEDTTLFDISAPKPTYLEFPETQLLSNLKEVLPDYKITELTEAEFRGRIDNATNQIPTVPSFPSNRITFSQDIQNMTTIMNTTVNESGVETVYKLCTFVVKMQKQYLNEIRGMIGRITFDNPDGNQICVMIKQKMLYRTTCGDHVNFSISEHENVHLTPGQIVQTIASGIYDEYTRKYFPDFCNGNPLSQYINTSSIDGIEIIGIPDDAPISVECYTIMKSAYGLPFCHLWSTYSYSF